MASSKHIERASSETASSVIFPLSESPHKHAPSLAPLRAPHLPFRRISLPTAPSLLHRVSVVSVASFDSLPEDSNASPPPSAWSNYYNGKLGKGRPIPPESPRRRNRLRDTSTKPLDELQTNKRRKVVREFYETEKAYVDGLDLVYSHFLTPIIASLDSPEPLLHRSALTSIFSNFIDIWNFHRSFLSSLTTLLAPPAGLPSTSSSPLFDQPIPPLSPLLLSHFPYLSLYNPFVTAFPSTTSAINDLVLPPTATRPNPLYDAKFADFLVTQEADPRCGKLKLRDWLLTIVQRCPRYLLLLKDLISCTDKGDSEHSGLIAVHTLVSKITLSLNTSLHTHAQTLSLLALQRATPNLPLKLISPGRTLLKRGSLYQVERGSAPMQREFLLFSDCLLWLAPIESHSWDWDWSWSGSGSGISQNSAGTTDFKTSSTNMIRTRSKSEAEISSLKDDDLGSAPDSSPVSPQKLDRRKSHYHDVPSPPPSMVKKHGSNDDKFVYKGRVELVDIEVVVGSALEDERRFEVLSPEGSFVVYAATEEERDDWTSEIRGAKTQLFVSLNVTNPNSTLTSSSSTNHIRRSLQALPFPPSDDRLGALRTSSSCLDVISVSLSPNGKGRKKDKEKRGHSAERRRKVDHWVPAIWIPDGKTSSCMRCGRSFGWRRRRHHCRLCGRCICASCSGRTFFISDSNAKQQDSSSSSTKTARACDACYDTVFPLIHPHPPLTGEIATTNINNENSQKSDTTIPSLSHLPSWLSMPSLPVPRQPHALMAIDTTCTTSSSSRDIISSFDDDNNIDDVGSETEEREERKGRIRIKSPHQRERVRSYQQLLEDFQQEQQSHAVRPGLLSSFKASQSQMIRKAVGMDDDVFENGEDEDAGGVGGGGGGGGEEEEQDHPFYTPAQSIASSPVSSSRRKQPRRESTARRSKRFSLPAIGLQTTIVTARTSIEGEESVVKPVTTTGGGVGSEEVGEGGNTGLLKRYSLVLAGKNNSHQVDGGGSKGQHEHGGQAKGLAATRLSELLATSTKT